MASTSQPETDAMIARYGERFESEPIAPIECIAHMPLANGEPSTHGALVDRPLCESDQPQGASMSLPRLCALACLSTLFRYIETHE
jgi:hypothetical protein